MFHVMVLKGRVCVKFEQLLVIQRTALVIRVENGLERKKMVYSSLLEGERGSCKES